MRQKLLSVLLALCLLAGCSGATAQSQAEQAELTILATTYPVYLMTCAVVDGVDGIQVERLNTGQVSCLHDYTLSITDMKKIERADVIAMNGVELEEFMHDALSTSDAVVIDCSEGVELLENLSHHHEEEGHGHEGHDHDHGHFDPHYWMHPMYADYMVSRLRGEMCTLDPKHEQRYNENAENACNLLGRLDVELTNMFAQLKRRGIEIPGLITFHDGFQYFAWAYDLPLLRAIEEEAGSEASAREIVEITRLVQEHDIPVIFTEVSGSDATAKAISRETGCRVAQLSMCMDGPDGSLSSYLDAMRGNAAAVVNGFAGEEIVTK